MTRHPHRPDWIYVLLASGIALGIIFAAFATAAALALIPNGHI